MPFLIRSLAVAFVLIALFGCDSAAVNNAVDNINLPDVKLSGDPTPTPSSGIGSGSSPAIDPGKSEGPEDPIVVAATPTSAPPPAEPTFAPPSTGATPLPPAMILCEKTGGLTSNLTKIVFETADCDQGLPDANYYGFPLVLKVNGAMYEYQVEQPGDGMTFSPSVHLELANGATSDNYDVRVMYVRRGVDADGRPNLVPCSRTEFISGHLTRSAFEHDYAARECKGGIKPGASYAGMPVAVRFSNDAGQMGGYQMVAPSKLSIRTNSNYLGELRTTSLFYSAPRVECTISLWTTNFYQAGQFSFSADDCSEDTLPSANTFSIPTAVSISTGSTGFFVEQPLFGMSTLSIAFKAIGGGGSATFSTASFLLKP